LGQLARFLLFMSTTNTASSALYFAGSSTYAAQLQQTITQAVNIASLPMQQLQKQQTTLTGQQTELQTLTNNFSSLQNAITAFSNATGAGAFTSSVSDSSVASASISSSVMAGNYTLSVSSIGSQTNAVSKAGLTIVTDPSSQNIDSGSNYTLTVNGSTYTITDSSGTLNGLAQAITNSSADVQATVVNVGSSSSPDYRLSIQSLAYAPDSVQLNDGTNDLLTTLSTGSNVTYQVNGQPSTPISSSSRNITLSPGLSAQILTTGTTNINVFQSASGVENALASFANAYNSVIAELNRNRGQNGGALAGQSVVYQLQDTLQSLANFSAGSGSIKSLSALGLSFDETGNLEFDPGAFAQTASSAGSDLLNFIGTSSSGGFLQAANDFITSVTDPSTGILTQASQETTSQLSTLASKISDEQIQVTQLQQSLTTQMADADAAISSMEQQLTEITDLFSTMQANEKAYA
jgi:flagellar hook-associated protein 2